MSRTFPEVVAGSPGSPVEESWLRKFQEEDRQRLLKRPSVYEEQPQGTVEYSARMASFSFITTLLAAENIFANCFG